MRCSTKRGSRPDRTQPIERRILNAVIHVVHTRKQKPKAIYLTKTDRALLPCKNRNQIAGIPVRIGKRSVLYSDCWWSRAI